MELKNFRLVPTVNLLEQYVLSGKIAVVPRRAPRGARRAARHSPGADRAAHQMYLECTTKYGSLRAYWVVDLL